METLNDFLNEQMKDPEFIKEYEGIQKELNECTGINQADCMEASKVEL